MPSIAVSVKLLIYPVDEGVNKDYLKTGASVFIQYESPTHRQLSYRIVVHKALIIYLHVPPFGLSLVGVKSCSFYDAPNIFHMKTRYIISIQITRTRTFISELLQV
jgi:hypothetical protein